MAKSKRKSISIGLRFEILKRDRFRCGYCGVRAGDADLQVDHIVAVANGGTNDPSNLRASCAACNAGKSSSKLVLKNGDGEYVTSRTDEEREIILRDFRLPMSVAMRNVGARMSSSALLALINWWGMSDDALHVIMSLVSASEDGLALLYFDVDSGAQEWYLGNYRLFGADDRIARNRIDGAVLELEKLSAIRRIRTDKTFGVYFDIASDIVGEATERRFMRTRSRSLSDRIEDRNSFMSCAYDMHPSDTDESDVKNDVA